MIDEGVWRSVKRGSTSHSPHIRCETQKSHPRQRPRKKGSCSGDEVSTEAPGQSEVTSHTLPPCGTDFIAERSTHFEAGVIFSHRGFSPVIKTLWCGRSLNAQLDHSSPQRAGVQSENPRRASIS